MECKFCGLETNKRSNFCNRQHYFKWYYLEHREEKRAYDKSKYIPHPLPKKTEEEKQLAYKNRLQKAREYYHSHKEYYKQKAHENYLQHKDEKEYRERKRKNARNFYRRKKEKQKMKGI